MSLSETFLISPLSVPGCQLWLDAADPNGTGIVPANNTAISSWKDKSLNSNSPVVRGTVPLYQTNSFNEKYPSLVFNVSQYFGTFPTYKGTTLSGFLVANPSVSNNSGARFISLANSSNADFAGNSTTAMLTHSLATTGFYRTERNPLGVNYSTVVGTPAITNIIFDGTNCLFFANGTQTASNASTGPFDISLYSIGDGVQDNRGGQAMGNFCEIIIYTASLTTSQRQKIEGYLAWKWDLTANLPSTHPYKNSRPLNGIQLPPSLLVPKRPLTNVFVFNPTVLSNCVLWLDGADVSTLFQNSTGTLPVRATGSTVAYWRDKSGSANHASNTTAQPTVTFSSQNGLNVVNFNGAQYLTLSTSTLPTGNTECTFFFITRTTSTGVQVFFTYGTDPNTANRNPQFYYNSSVLNADLYGGGGLSDNTNYLNSYVMSANQFTRTTNIGWDNGTQYSGSSTAITLNTGTGWASIGVGRIPPGNVLGYYFSGQMGEMVVFSRALNTRERQAMEGYLAWKWGLESNLPVSHPFRRNPPDLPAAAPRAVPQLKDGSFNPRNISGCGVWLDASDRSTLTLSGSNVSQWRDKSGNGRNANSQVAAAYVRTTSGNALSFTGTNYYSFNNWSFVVNSYFSIFIVERLQASTNEHHILGTDSANTNIALHIRYNGINGTTNASTFRFAFYANDLDATNIPAFTTAAAQPTRVWSLVFTRNFRGIYLNGTLMASDANNSFLTAWSTPLLGTSFISFGGSRYYNGFMYEIVSYGGQITTLQRQQLEGYLAWKWKLQASLPSTHPFKLFPPSP